MAQLIVVVQASGPLEVRSVDAVTRVSTRVRTLDAPQDGAQALDVTMSAGPDPVVCASWHLGPGELDDGQNVLSCYPSTSEGRSEIEGVQRPSQIALNAAGTRLAWSLSSPGEQNPIFSTGTLENGRVTDVERRRGEEDEPDDSFTGTDVQDLGWSDDDHVLVSTQVQSDDGPELYRVNVNDGPERGWLRDGVVVPGPSSDGYTTYDGVQSADATTALATRRGYYLADEGDVPPDQAVRIRVSDGHVLQTIATVDKGRSLVSVTGTDRAAVYMTGVLEGDLWIETRAYLRLKGELRGSLISGLPDGYQGVVAQG